MLKDLFKRTQILLTALVFAFLISGAAPLAVHARGVVDETNQLEKGQETKVETEAIAKTEAQATQEPASMPVQTSETVISPLNQISQKLETDSTSVPATVNQLAAPMQAAQVTICHATASRSNPYVVLTVNQDSVDGDNGNDNGQGDHYLEHTGPVYNTNLPKNIQWGDIIPPITGVHNGLNWDAAGQAIYNNGCRYVVPPQQYQLELSHAASCGAIEVTLRNVSPWIYAADIEVDGVNNQYAIVVDNRTDTNGDGKLDLNGPAKDQSVTKTYTFAEDSGVHTIRYRVSAGTESNLYVGQPVGNWSQPITIESDCQPNPVPPIPPAPNKGVCEQVNIGRTVWLNGANDITERNKSGADGEVNADGWGNTMRLYAATDNELKDVTIVYTATQGFSFTGSYDSLVTPGAGALKGFGYLSAVEGVIVNFENGRFIVHIDTMPAKSSLSFNAPITKSTNTDIYMDSSMKGSLVNCGEPGMGGGGTTPYQPNVPSTSPAIVAITPTQLPMELPRTGGETSLGGLFIALLAAILTYGAVFFVQPKKRYNQI